MRSWFLKDLVNRLSQVRWMVQLDARAQTVVVNRCSVYCASVRAMWSAHAGELTNIVGDVVHCVQGQQGNGSTVTADPNIQQQAGIVSTVHEDARRRGRAASFIDPEITVRAVVAEGPHVARLRETLFDERYASFVLDLQELQAQHANRAGEYFADYMTVVFARSLHAAQVEMMKLAATSMTRSSVGDNEEALRARNEELQEAVTAADRRLVSRDVLIQTLKRRATAAEDQVTQLQEELHSLEQTNKERERQLQAAASRLQDQQQLSMELRSALAQRDEELIKVRESGYVPTGSSLQPGGGAGGLLADLTPENVGRQGATTFLREQLSQQMDLLQRIEESEQRAAHERATILVANTMGQLFTAIMSMMLHDRAEYLDWMGGRMQEERLFLRERLVEAAEQLAEMERHKQRLEELIAGTYKSSALASDIAMMQPFHLSSLYHVVEVAMTAPTSSHVLTSTTSLFSRGIGGSGGGTSLTTQPMMFTGYDHQLEQHAQHLAIALGALFLEVKLEFNQLQLQAHRSLLRMFWALAPKERASSHVRVHILEGALAVSESQRLQSVTVAQWLEEQCSVARDALMELLRETKHAVVGWEDSKSTTSQYTGAYALPPSTLQYGAGPPRFGSIANPSLLNSPAASPRHGLEGAGLDASYTFHSTKRSLHVVTAEEDLLQLQDNMAVADRRAARDAVVAHQTCDRLLETFTALQNRLLEAEVAAQHAIGDTTERNIETEELRQQLDRQVLTHALEQEIADDAVSMLREMLRVERREAQHLIQSLLDACSLRDLAILGHCRDALKTRNMMRLVLLLAQYVNGAYEATLELSMENMIQCAQWVRTATIPTPKEVAFALTTVHWEYGKALEAAAADVRLSFGEVGMWLKSIHDDNYYLRKELASAAATLNRFAQERAAEKVAMDAFQTFILHGIEDAFATQGRSLWEHVLVLRESAWSALSQHARSHEKVLELQHMTSHLCKTLRASEVELDEHRVALASASEAVTAIDNVLAERLATLRERELELQQLRTRHDEHESLLASLRSQIVTYHEMLVTAAAEKDSALDQCRHQGTTLVQSEKAVIELKKELEDLTLLLEEERGAHRHTIKSIADTFSGAK
ncbi:Hypothetical protein, putative [Bodo saltans]|uniref:Uncharacterized protein n=1 Tax=Bodo saltans TaxID=75058 RepID=A0A0S4IQW9_BODSA|nr:Hypothetical protein, putative [Bodo saltans]|eukprot:CUF35101.1 Hypothetical protein, putative [Bodo saltans]